MGLICLQGGNEFASACRDMDTLLVERAAGGPVVILPLAGAPGREYDTAGANGARYYAELGGRDVTVAPDAREEPANALAAVHRARLLVIPGGSPRRLRDAVYGTPLHDAIDEAAADPDRVLTGSSAGAMLLGSWMLLPEGRGAPEVAEGIGVAAGFGVVPHFAGSRPPWENALTAVGADVLGIPECSGLLIDGAQLSSIGTGLVTLIQRTEIAAAATR